MHALILGANSDVARPFARILAEREKASIQLASRDLEPLERSAADLKVRGASSVSVHEIDLRRFERHHSFYTSLDPRPDLVAVFAGYLGEKAGGTTETDEIRMIFESNFAGCAHFLEIAAADLAVRRTGCIIGVSSVAGERGRKANYLYGSAKAGFTAYLSGLRNRLHPDVHVLTILPGFIRTKMTEGQDLPPLLTASPDRVASDIYQAFRKGKDVVYTPWFWRCIMRVAREIPEPIFKRSPT